MCNRQAQQSAFSAAVGKWRTIHLHASDNHVTHEPQRTVAHQCAGQKTSLTQNLKSIACAEHEFASASVADHCFHHRRKMSDGSATQVIAVRKPSGQDDGVEIIERGFLVPDELGTQSIHTIDTCDTILIAV